MSLVDGPVGRRGRPKQIKARDSFNDGMGDDGRGRGLPRALSDLSKHPHPLRSACGATKAGDITVFFIGWSAQIGAGCLRLVRLAAVRYENYAALEGWTDAIVIIIIGTIIAFIFIGVPSPDKWPNLIRMIGDIESELQNVPKDFNSGRPPRRLRGRRVETPQHSHRRSRSNVSVSHCG